MECAACGSQIRDGRKFCSQCGAPLSVQCPSCGEANEAGSRFCGECGTALVADAPEAAIDQAPSSRPEPATERRLVSVLFTDMVGFTSLSEGRDSEDVRALLTRYFDTASEIVARYGGTIEKFIGDAVMAVWGTPTTREDDAERAVRAALDLVEAAKAIGAEAGAPFLQLRAGVTTGEGAVTIGAQNQGMVAGDLVNTAARLQSVAEPGTVFVGEGTYQAARSAIQFDDTGEHELKGKAERVRAWRALRVVAGPSVARSEAIEPPFVGRDEEFRLVKNLFHLTDRERTARLLLTVGIGGIGKSRLAREFLKYIDGLVDDIYWHHGRCPSYGEGIAFWALAEMVRMRSLIAETDDDETARKKLAAMLNRYIPAEEQRRWMEPKLLHLLGLAEIPDAQREELFPAWRSLFEHISDLGTTVLVFEDVQWADPGLIRFIEHLMEWAGRRPIFVIVLARPELEDRHPSVSSGRHATSLHLTPLSRGAMDTMLREMIAGASDRLLSTIVDRAEGVPLYAIESVRALVDRGALRRDDDGSLEQVSDVDAPDVPETLQALIAARLDVLSPDDRSLLQQASVLGKSFTLDGLVSVGELDRTTAEERLRTLTRREFLVLDADPRSPERGQYAFVQALIREVAYQTLSKRDRRALHLAAAHHFESLDDDALAAAVATHYMEARRASNEGPDALALAARARDWLIAAAERAASLGSYDSALSHLEQAIDVEESEGSKAELRLQAGEVATSAGAETAAERNLNEAMEWFEKNGDRGSAIRARTALATMMLNIGSRATDAMTILRPLFDQVKVDGPLPAELVEPAAALARTYMLSEEPDHCLAWAEAALRLVEAGGRPRLVADLLITKGSALVEQGRLHEGTILMRGGTEIAVDEGFAYEELRGAINLSFLLVVSDPVEALRVGRRGYDRARKLGRRAEQVLLVGNAAEAALECADVGWLEESVAEMDADGWPPELVGYAALTRARLLTARGRPDEAQAVIDEHDDVLVAHPEFRREALDIRSVIALAGGHPKDVLAILAEIDETFPVSVFVPRLLALRRVAHSASWLQDHEGLARSVRQLADASPPAEPFAWSLRSFEATRALLGGDDPDALSRFTTALEGIRRTGAAFDVALHQIGLMHALGPEHEASREAADEAREIFTRMGGGSWLDRLDDALKVGTPAER